MFPYWLERYIRTGDYKAGDEKVQAGVRTGTVGSLEVRSGSVPSTPMRL